MAEIKVEPRRGGLGWLWAIVLLIVLGAAVWYFFVNSRPAAVTSPTDTTRTSMFAPRVAPELTAVLEVRYG